MKHIPFFSISLIWSLLSLPFSAFPQEKDTSYLLEMVQVTGELIPLPHSRSLDSNLISLYPLSGIQQLLSYSNAAAIRSYGPGLLNTASINGLGAQHTAVIWEGFNLQSSMNGVLDLSLIPLFSDQNLVLAEGGRSATLGNGAIGGALVLSNQSHPSAVGSLVYQFSSISQHQTGLNFSIPNLPFRNRTRLFHTYQENRFYFNNTTQKDAPREKATPKIGRTGGFQQEFGWSGGPNDLEFKLWYQKGGRQLRPSILAADPDAEQEDEMLNTAFSWKRKLQNGYLRWKSGFFLESIEYRQEVGEIHTLSRANRWVNQINYQLTSNKGELLKAGLQHSLAIAQSDAYLGKPRQEQISAFVGGSLPFSGWELSSHFRLNQVLESREWTWAGEVLVRRDFQDWGTLSGRLSRDFRIPGLNDLYWVPGGNADLRSETSYHASLKWKIERRAGNSMRLSFGISPYHYLVDNWILWQPNGETGIWEPDNVQQVWSRGLEIEGGGKHQWAKAKLSLAMRFRIGKASVEESTSGGRLETGKQLIYTPEHQGSGSLTLELSSWRIQYLHQLTGRRFISTSNQTFLPSFQLGALHFLKSWQIGEEFRGNLQFSIENIWNQHYQSIAYFPEPLRFFRFGFQINLMNSTTNHK
jgi:vitamin B12 transporter